MPPPSPLAIATSSLQRLIKEEASYHKELSQQEARLEKARTSADEDQNKEYTLKQEQTAIEETKAVFPSLHLRIADSLAKLEDQLEAGNGTEVERAKANEVVEQAKAVAAIK